MPGVDKATDLARALGISLQWLSTGAAESEADREMQGRLLRMVRSNLQKSGADPSMIDQLIAVNDELRVVHAREADLLAEIEGRKAGMHLESSDVAAGLRGAPTTPASRAVDTVQIPELDVRAAMGEGGFALEVLRENVAEHTIGTYGFPRDGFLQLFGAPPENIVIIEAVGDSNVPEILPGQRVMIDVSDRRPSPPGFFALWDGLSVVLKRVEYIMNSDPPSITLISANPAYAPRTITLGEAHILGRVKGNWVRR